MPIKASIGRFSALFLSVFLTGVQAATAETGAAKGPAEVRFCTQNLFNYGLPAQGKNAQRPADQKRDLIGRMTSARCDLVALQEVTGKDQRRAQRTVDDLANTLTMITGKRFTGMLGESRNDRIRNGFLVSDRAGTVLSTRSFYRFPLPPLQRRGPAQSFTRGPLAILLEVRPQTGAPPKRLIVINLHFKSSHDGWKDPSGTDYEAIRMEMAEAVRRGADEMVRGYGRHVPIVIMGDRNADEFSATSAILSGERVLDDFRIAGRCSLGEKNQPVCGRLPAHQPEFVPLFATKFRGQDTGSYRYKSRNGFIDEILIGAEDLELVQNTRGELAVGITGEFYHGSDHKLLWAELNW